MPRRQSADQVRRTEDWRLLYYPRNVRLATPCGLFLAALATATALLLALRGLLHAAGLFLSTLTRTAAAAALGRFAGPGGLSTARLPGSRATRGSAARPTAAFALVRTAGCGVAAVRHGRPAGQFIVWYSHPAVEIVRHDAPRL